MHITVSIVTIYVPENKSKSKLDLFSNDPSSSSDGEILSDDDTKNNSDPETQKQSYNKKFDDVIMVGDFGGNRLQRAAAMEQKLLSIKQPKRRSLTKLNGDQVVDGCNQCDQMLELKVAQFFK